jgi:UDPglucose 6-dehydrogenase
MIAVIGLGKVGLPLVAAIVQANYKVLGIDNNKKLAQELVTGINNCPEKKVTRIIKKYNSNIQFNSDFDSCKKISIFFLIVPTPSNLDSSFSNTYVISAIKNILKYSEKKKIYILLNSTLSPGSIDKIIIPFIKKNKKKGSAVEFIYNPLFIALGNVFEGITDPMSVLLGYNKINFPRNIYNIFSRILKRKKINFFYLSYKEAEIAKLVSNCIDTTRVSFANLIGLICNDSKNANSDKINFFLKSRISNRINCAGTPYGGPCWPRDNRALAFSMKKKLNNFNLIPNSVHKFNDLYTSYLIKKTATIIKKKNKIILFGIGYKNGTDEIVESFSYKLLKFLKNKRKKIKVFNENKNPSNKNTFNNANIEYFDHSNEKNLLNFQVIILAHRKLFIDFNTFKKLLKKNIIIVDYWRLYDYRHTNYYTFG